MSIEQYYSVLLNENLSARQAGVPLYELMVIDDPK